MLGGLAHAKVGMMELLGMRDCCQGGYREPSGCQRFCDCGRREKEGGYPTFLAYAFDKRKDGRRKFSGWHEQTGRQPFILKKKE